MWVVWSLYIWIHYWRYNKNDDNVERRWKRHSRAFITNRSASNGSSGGISSSGSVQSRADLEMAENMLKQNKCCRNDNSRRYVRHILEISNNDLKKCYEVKDAVTMIDNLYLIGCCKYMWNYYSRKILLWPYWGHKAKERPYLLPWICMKNAISVNERGFLDLDYCWRSNSNIYV